jgi:alkylation response protein AidB-like acyl-CoA dehydrogenase
MDKLLTETQERFRDEIASFAAEEVTPHVEEWERTKTFPDSAVRAAARRGLLGLVIPPEYGGRGLDHVSHGLFIREIARVCSGAALTFDAMTTVGVEPILFGGSDELKQQWLPRVARGELVAAFSITEPGAGSDAGNMEASAKFDGDGYVLSGHKTLCTNAGFADLYVVNAKTVDAAGKPVISAFVVENGTPGLTFGPPLEKLGLFGSVQAEIFLEDVRVPITQRIGNEGDGMRLAMRSLDSGRIGVAFQAVGTAEAALRAATAYVVERHAFGQALADFQGIQFQLADLEADLASASALAWQAAHLCDRGLPFSRDAAIAKLVATEACMRICSGALDLLGGHGYTRHHPLERCFRDAKGMQQYEGTSNVQRIVISRAALRAARATR